LEFPQFEIDLALPPKERFAEVSLHYREGIVSVMNSFFILYPTVAYATLFLWEKFYWIWQFTQPERYAELEGIVETINHQDLTMAKAVLINQLYELGTWCTSIVAKQADGTIIHSRNLDYNHGMDQMRSITYRARYVYNGTYVFDAVMFAGTLGVYTGMKANAFSVSQNTRFDGSNPLNLVSTVGMMYGGLTENSW